MKAYCICLSLTYITFHNTLQVHPCCYMNVVTNGKFFFIADMPFVCECVWVWQFVHNEQFIWMNSLDIWMDSLFVHSSFDEHLDCLCEWQILLRWLLRWLRLLLRWLLWIMLLWTLGVQISFQISVVVFFIFSGYITRIRIAGSYDHSIFNFWENLILFPEWLYQCTFWPAVY